MPHEAVATLALMPVAPQGRFKALTCGKVKVVGGRMVLANAYHV